MIAAHSAVLATAINLETTAGRPLLTRVLPVATLVLLLSGCGGSDSTIEQTATRAGFDFKNAHYAPEPEGPVISPAGRVIEPGARDELGYVLPLDIKRPWLPDPGAGSRPPGPLPSMLTRGSPFDEHRVSPDDGHSQNETTIAALDDTVVGGWNAYTNDGLIMGVTRSTDQGQTWSSGLIMGHTAMSDPAVKAGGNGLWYYGYLAQGGPSPWIEIYVRRSTDAGATWQDPSQVTSGSAFDDKPYIDARGNEVLVGWADFSFSPAKVRASRSIDGGVTFGENHILANNSVGGNGACPVIDRNGTYYMFWRDSFQESLWVSVSTDQGTTWSRDRGIVAMNPLPSSLPPGFRMVNLPSADAHPLTGELVVVWNDQLFGDGDILSIRSTDSGATWSSPVRVNDDASGEDQFFPWITYDETGVAHVVWYDRREDGFKIDVYYTRSLDSGQSFETNVRVTAQAFLPVLPWEPGAPSFIGDYNGIAATAAWAYPFYQDSREGEQDVYVARIPGSTTDVASVPRRIGEPRILASPSPFSTSTTLRVLDADAAGSGALEALEIFDSSGRKVRTLRVGPGGAVDWDGQDGSGHELPDGVYFARVGERGASVRIVKVM